MMSDPSVMTTGAASVEASTASFREAGPGASPRAALRDLQIRQIPAGTAKTVLRKHYLGSLPGATQITLGVFLGPSLEGAVTLGCGPMNGHRLVEGASRDDYLCLTRLWLSELLPKNSESRVLAIVARLLRRYTEVKFLLSYADPSRGHVGTIYQAAGWTYVGRSSASDLYRVGSGKPQHSRTLSQLMGSHSLKYLRARGLHIEPIRQLPKHKYVRFLDPTWADRLIPGPKPYPKEVEEDEDR